jgi:hypothetical protein
MEEGADMSNEGSPAQKSNESGWWIMAKVLLFLGVPFLLIYLMKTAIP